MSHGQGMVGTHGHMGDGCGKKRGEVQEPHVFCDTSLSVRGKIRFLVSYAVTWWEDSIRSV